MNRQVLEAVAELVARGSLKEDMASSLLLRSVAKRRRRVKGRFADESPRVRTVPSERAPGPRRERRDVPSAMSGPYADDSVALAHRPETRFEADGLRRADEAPGDADRASRAKARSKSSFTTRHVGRRAWTHEELEKYPPTVLEREPDGHWDDAKVQEVADLLQGQNPSVLDSQKLFKPGGKKNAKGEYEGGKYTAERLRFHNAIARAFLRGLPQGVEDREVLFMAGGSASGKSSMLKSGTVKMPEQSVLINPDAIKGMLPEYREAITRGDVGAAGSYHEESGDVAKMIMQMALARKMNITVDKTKIKPEEVAKVQALGYRARAAVATLEIAVARERAKERGDQNGRYIDDGILIPNHQLVARNFEEWVRETKIPFTLVDTRRQLTLATAEDGKLTVLPGMGFAYTEFLKRAERVDDALDPASRIDRRKPQKKPKT